MTVATGRRRAVPATEPQRRHIRRLLGGHVRGVAHRPGRLVFANESEAKCYALARHAPRPRTRREASALIEALARDRERFRREARGERFDEEYAIVEVASRSEHRCWRRRAGGPLLRFGYPGDGWLERLNGAIEAAWAERSYGERLEMERFPDRFRAYLLDPAFGVERGKGQGG